MRGSSRLASLDTATRRFIMQKARRHPINRAPTACRRMVSGTISLPSSGCFSPFPHGTRALSVSREYLALPDGPGGFAQDSSCPALLRIPLGLVCVHVRDCLPRSLATTGGIISYFLFLEVLRCFSSLRSPPYIHRDSRPSDGWVVPFGNPRIKGYLLLPAAYRSLSRPSSPP